MPSDKQILSSWCKKKYDETDYAYHTMADPNDNGFANYLSGRKSAFKQVMDFLDGEDKKI